MVIPQAVTFFYAYSKFLTGRIAKNIDRRMVDRQKKEGGQRGCNFNSALI